VREPSAPRVLDRPDDPLGDDADLLLALALNDQRAAVRTVAVDVTISALDDGRLDPQELASSSVGCETASRPLALGWVPRRRGRRRVTIERSAAGVGRPAIADPPKP
jgi:hypothetical protein